MECWLLQHRHLFVVCLLFSHSHTYTNMYIFPSSTLKKFINLIRKSYSLLLLFFFVCWYSSAMYRFQLADEQASKEERRKFPEGNRKRNKLISNIYIFHKESFFILLGTTPLKSIIANQRNSCYVNSDNV